MNSKIRGILIVVTVIIFIIFVIAEVVISYFSTFGFHGLGDEKGDWGTFGDFIGGVLNPLLSLCGFIALLWTLLEQREQLNRTDKAQARQAFEGAFFEFFKVHNEVLYRESEKIKETKDRVFLVYGYPAALPTGKNELRNLVKNKLKEEKHFYGHYFPILFQLLKFIAVNSDNGINEKFQNKDIENDDVSVNEKMYSNLIRALLTNDVMKLLEVNCYCDNGESDIDWSYKLLIERYSFFEYISFDEKINKSMSLEYHLDFKSYYEEKAFGKQPNNNL